MKKIGTLLIGLLLSTPLFAATATTFTDGKQYTTFDKPATAAPQALEFFSFYCPHCYDFEFSYHLPAQIKKAVPEGGEFLQYHVNFLGPLGKDLTRAWAVAMVMGVEAKVQPVLFEGIQKTQSIKSAQDIRAAFESIGVNGTEYDAALNSFMVNSLVAKQEQAAQTYEIRGVPAVIINGKYQINMGGIEAKDTADFTQQYDGLVKFLLQQR
ncbi:MAG: thiol:disulfide interchange protein DsbA [Plesiomonas sp.]|uniref:thiol:disulfide interchange protein DsbA n=1 Tax=Plesiomonas sp. TaxID=2486279 RepID=UPI003EE5B888